MKLFIILAAIAWSNGAKLDRTYLPPNYAQSSGGSGNFLQTPVSGSDFQNNYNQNGQDFQNNYAQNDDSFAQNGNDFAQNRNFAQDNARFNAEDRPERAQAAFERNAAILRQDNQNDGEIYAYAYETENGITAEENGVATNGVEAQGGYSYTGDDGQVYTVRYTAGQNGFVPEGDHLPTPPPIPEEILKALEQNARDEANGIFDDGSYSESKYNDDANNQYNEGYNYNNGNGNNFNAGGDFNNNLNSGADNFNSGADNSDDDSVVTTNALIRSNNGFNNNNNGVAKAYLPPFQQNGQRSQAFNQPQNNYNQAQNNGFNQPQNNGFRNQAQNVEKAYLPPEQFGQRNQNGAGNNRYNQARNGLRNQAQGVEKAYLPPFDRSQTAAIVGPSFNQAQNYRNQASRGQASNAANREYLPPSANERNNGRGFSRRPSFNARNGYQY